MRVELTTPVVGTPAAVSDVLTFVTAPRDLALSEAGNFETRACGLAVDDLVACADNTLAMGDVNGWGLSSAPHTVYVGAECYMNPNETYESYASEGLANGITSAVLNQIAEDVTPSSAADVSAALVAALVDAGAKYSGIPTILVTAETLVDLAAAGLLDWGSGKPVIPNGSAVVTIPGRAGRGLWAVGHVTVYLSDAETFTSNTWNINRTMAVAQQTFAYAFDCNYSIAKEYA